MLRGADLTFAGDFAFSVRLHTKNTGLRCHYSTRHYTAVLIGVNAARAVSRMELDLLPSVQGFDNDV